MTLTLGMTATRQLGLLLRLVKSQGFSFIEEMIVLGVVATMIAFVIPSLAVGSRNYRLKAFARKTLMNAHPLKPRRQPRIDPINEVYFHACRKRFAPAGLTFVTAEVEAH